MSAYQDALALQQARDAEIIAAYENLITAREAQRLSALSDDLGALGLNGSLPVYGTVGLYTPVTGGASHLLARTTTENGATRIHVEPNGFVDDGTVSKLDLMFDEYEGNGTNYRIVNLYTKVGNGNGLNGENGCAVLGLKGVGDQFGIYPSLHFGFSDDGATGVPMKMYYFDMSDTAWRTPNKGAWREGRADIVTGDYVLANYCLYQAQSTATTGETKPSHQSGTVSDGSVDWLFIRNYSGATSNHIKPVVLFGDRDDMPKFGLESVRTQHAKDVAVWNGVNLSFLSNSSPVASVAYNVYTPVNTFDLYIKSTAVGAGFFRFGASGKFVQMSGMAHLCSQKTDSTLLSAVDISGAELITMGNASATTVTSFSGGSAYQKFFVLAGNGNTTLQNNANIVLAGGVSRTLAAGMLLQFIMNGGGTIAYQVIT